MAWQDPTITKTEEVNSQPSPPQASTLPPISSYGAPGQTWNVETMKLLVEIEIPQGMFKGHNEKLFVWFKQALMQIQFGNYTKKNQEEMIKDLRYILFLAQQEGNEQIVFEEQLLFVSNMEISKGRSDKPDGLRERTMWIMQIMKNMFGQEDAKRPEENKGTFKVPFVG
jgi:hypothetical protein